MAGVIYEGKRIKVVQGYNDGTYKKRPKGTPYWTVINTNNNCHRHYDIKQTALAVGKRAEKIDIPRTFSHKLKQDVIYLLTGDENVYKKVN